MRSSECDVVSLYVVCFYVNVSVCFVCCVLDSVCELFVKTIRNVFGCSCYFVVPACGPPASLSVHLGKMYSDCRAGVDIWCIFLISLGIGQAVVVCPQ